MKCTVHIHLGWLLAALLLSCGVAYASDHSNLEEGLPVEVEDAYAIGRGGREIQTLTRYEHTADDKDRVVLEPRLEVGLWNNLQGRVSLPFYLGSASRTDSGNIALELFYNFNTEGLYLPAFAVSLRADMPTGTDSRGVDTTLKAIATRSVSRTGLDRVHLNVAWEHNGGAYPDQREHMYRLVVGYSRRVTADWLLVADLVRETEIEKDHESNLVEAGFRGQITPLLVLGIGIGVGIAEESPDVRTTISLQHAF
jgi:hypothetical protein